ncbi:hypothetical protein SAMN02745866_01824 [Alteromonadaceae bacterium Bs31]|nr:hypothetical protein SAMN02745866_01824 [Alteromonadaceae bacterium Bs31]
MKIDKKCIYSIIENKAIETKGVIERFNLGLTWSSCKVFFQGNENLGFAMSPQDKSRILQWPGTIAGQTVASVAHNLRSWNNFDVTMALSACNGAINSHHNLLLQEAELLPVEGNANVTVFNYFKPKLKNKKIVVVGRYPHLDSAMEGLDYTVLERQPQNGDLPDTAAEDLIPQADWVFITSSSLINKTFPRLSELAKNAVTVLMGPTTPWLAEFVAFDVDFLAGVKVTDGKMAEQIAMEGGGTRLFEGGVRYALANLSASRLKGLKKEIAKVAEARSVLKRDMDAWYQKGQAGRFSHFAELEAADLRLSQLDTAYKRLWDANRG